jgi:hypothetical protein
LVTVLYEKILRFTIQSPPVPRLCANRRWPANVRRREPLHGAGQVQPGDGARGQAASDGSPNSNTFYATEGVFPDGQIAFEKDPNDVDLLFF